MTAKFVTRVGEEGEWPEPPDHWSFSTLTEAESCPLRYALRHATYTGLIYSGPGYPDKITEAALVGTVIHATVEQVLKALRLVPDASDPVAASMALRQLGGYTKAIDRCVQVVEERLSSNPRMEARVPRLAANLRRRTPEIRSAVQGLVARLPSPPTPASLPTQPPGTAIGAGRPRAPLRLGRHPEARLQADTTRFKGQIDLLTVGDRAADIVDFKSGVHDDRHAEQLRLYGLLWLLDTVANPNGLPVGTMTVAYPGSNMTIPRPAEWAEVEAELRNRIASADNSLAAPPPAQLSEACATCPVRHMCEPYWRSDYPMIGRGSFADIEAEVIARNGTMSWSVRLVRTTEPALVRTASEDIELTEGGTVRLLDVASERQVADDGATEVVVLTAVATSEIFPVTKA